MDTKKPNLSIDADDDDKDYEAFDSFLNEDTLRKKNHIASEFEQIGETLLGEIERKKKVKDLVRIKLISYILKHGKTIYTKDELKSYSFEDVQQIHDEIKANRKPAFIKFFHFIFNLE